MSELSLSRGANAGVDLAAAFAGKRVLLTGHTGFKGSWLALWLEDLGAEVHGLALPPPTEPSLFEICGIESRLGHHIGDIRDAEATRSRVLAVRPDVVFHLAAQPIVRRSYLDPLETMATNVMGTAHVLEGVRALEAPCAVVVVSSDKCYENRSWVWGYRESDPMGGSDPYSASKGATELVTTAWRRSFFSGGPVKLASARAGNVIGGGDWAADRIIPDCIRAFAADQPVLLRNPAATRPWQHVLEPLGGYLLLAARLLGPDPERWCEGWNFGPAPQDVRPVSDLVALAAESWGAGCSWSGSPGPHPKEAAMLSLNCDKAIAELGWQPTWDCERMIRETVHWFRAWRDGATDMLALTRAQIADFAAETGWLAAPLASGNARG
jgi:CDP-glucose 4,6-dehydratase